jgi:hypothetical protein
MGWVERIRFRKRPQDRRKSPRGPGGGLVAHYWTGGAPSPRSVSNVSVDGAYIEAPDKWYPGTVITLIFQLDSAHSASPCDEVPAGSELSPCTIRAVVVRSAQDGFAVEFLFVNHDERAAFQQFLEQTLGTGVPGATPLSRTNAAGGS